MIAPLLCQAGNVRSALKVLFCGARILEKQTASWSCFPENFELVDAFTYEEGSNLKLYDLLLATLESLNQGDNPSIVIHYYELHLLDLVGFRPELFNCVECGGIIIDQNQFLSGELGGVICPECITDMKGGAVRPISARTLKYLRHFQRSSLQSLLGLNIQPEILEELEIIIRYYLTHTLEGHLNSPDFLERIKE